MNNFAYSVDLTILDDGLVVDGSQRLKNLNILSDYTEYTFPIVYIDLLLTVEEYRNITNRPDLVISISIRRFKATDGNTLENYDYVLQDKLFSVVNEDNYYIQQPINDDARNLEKSNLIPYRLLLIDKDDLEYNKKNVHGTFINTDLYKVLLYLVTRFETDKKIVVDKTDNSKIYEQVILPFNNIVSTINYLDTVYGLYKNGIKLFFDLDTNYLLNRDINNSPKESIIFSIKNDESLLGKDNNTDDKVINVLHSNLQYNAQPLAKKEYMGNNNTFIMTTDNHIDKMREARDMSLNDKMIRPSSVMNKDKSKVYYQTYENPFTSNQLNANNDTLIKLNIINSDYSLYNFVNEYYIKDPDGMFTDGKFSLLRYFHNFTRTKGDYYELYSSASLKKI